MNDSIYTDIPAVYEITVLGILDQKWSVWFGELNIENSRVGENNVSILTGTIEDQSALHGILKKINDLNLMIISIIRKN